MSISPSSPQAASGVSPVPSGNASNPPISKRQFFGFMVMVVGMFMAILDIQIVASSLSQIQAGLAASADEISWVQTSYLIAEVVMIPFSGFLSRLLSTRVLFTICAVGFTIMSALCSLAWNMESMIVFRALQGFIGGGMIPTVFATSYLLFPQEKRAGITVLIGLTATLAPTIGPTLGGYLTESFSWHWLFLINLVPGTIVAVVTWRVMKIDEGDKSLLKGFDFLGLLTMALFLGSLEYVLEEGPRHDWLNDTAIFNLTLLCGVSAVIFFWRSLNYHNPIVDLTAFKDVNFALGCLYSFTIGIGLYGAVYIMPLFFSRVQQFNALEIGKTMMVVGMFQFLSAPLAGALSKKMDLRLMLALGFALFGLGLVMMARLTHDSGYWDLFLPQAVRGISLMFCFVPINQLALGTLAPDKLKNASGLYNLMRNLGGALGLAVINTILISRFAHHKDHIASNLTPSNPNAQGFLEGLSQHLSNLNLPNADMAALQNLVFLAEREAMVLTFNDCLLLMGGWFFVSLLMMPLIRPPKPLDPTAASDGH